MLENITEIRMITMLESQSCVVEYKCANNFLKMHLVHRNQKVVYDERENPQHSRKKLFEQSGELKHSTEYGVEFRIEPRGPFL